MNQKDRPFDYQMPNFDMRFAGKRGGIYGSQCVNQVGMVPQAVNYMTPIFMYPHLQGEYAGQGASSFENQDEMRSTRPRAEWTHDQTGFLLQLWADNYNYINSYQSKKAWKKVLAKFTEKYPISRTIEQIKRKINYHIGKYREECDRNQNYSHSHTECDYFDIISRVLGPQGKIICSEEVETANQTEREIKTEAESVEGDSIYISETESLSAAVPVVSSSDGFEAREQHLSEVHGEQNAAYEVSEQAGTQPLGHIQDRRTRKRGKKTTKDQARIDDVIEKMAKQGDDMVAVVKRMEENARNQTRALLEISRSIGLLIARQGMQTTKSRTSPRRKRLRREDDLEDIDTY